MHVIMCRYVTSIEHFNFLINLIRNQTYSVFFKLQKNRYKVLIALQTI